MRRLRRENSHVGQDRWLISYADFITLLFAFFVVMYSISSVNEGKYKVLSETLEGVFNTRQKSLEPIQVGEMSHRTESPQTTDGVNPVLSGRNERFETEKEQQKEEVLESIAGEFEESFKDLIFEEHLEIKLLDDWVEISLRDNVLFESGGVIPSARSFEIIQRVGAVLRGKSNGILIEGHTDNRSISSDQFPSNWELSVARAATFLRLLAIEGVDESRMAAMGFGQFRPVVRNDTPAGRRKNRRIVILVSRTSDLRDSLLN